MHRVLVLMSTYNGEKYVVEQIESIENQRNVTVSLLIRDDGSTDGTIALIESLKQRYRNIELILGQNVGCVASYGMLLQEAYHRTSLWDFVAFADQDDVWLENKLVEGCIRLSFMSQTRPSMYCSNLTLVDSQLEEIGKMYQETPSLPKHHMHSLVVNLATGCTMVVNKAVVNMFCNRMPTIMRMHDSWIYQMCIFLGEVYFDANSHILYRQHGNNVEGWTNNFVQKAIRKIHNIDKFKDCSIGRLAIEMLNCYSSLLSKDDKESLRVLATYRQSIKNRLKLVCRARKYGIYRDKIIYNLILKIRIILGYL